VREVPPEGHGGIVSGYRQVRRCVRQARRAGMEPMTVINSGNQSPEPLCLVIVSALGWLAFRHQVKSGCMHSMDE
jgi:hypothetical protein